MTRIVAIEDDMLLGRMYSKKLEQAGYTIDLYDNGEKALASIKKNPPVLVISDVILPGMNGMEILENLKKNKATKKIPFVFLSNLSRSEEDVRKGLELGAIAYLLKVEMTPEEIVAKIKEYIEAYSPNKVPESAAARLDRAKKMS
jgi:DNA-binding response OmpR family regulator